MRVRRLRGMGCGFGISGRAGGAGDDELARGRVRGDGVRMKPRVHAVGLALALVSCSGGPDAGGVGAVRGTLVAGHPVSGNPGPAIARWCRAQEGRKVGNGECWTLANEAFMAVGARRPGPDMRVWGREIDPSREGVKAGDVLEFRNARFSNGMITGAEHTAVVVGGGPQTRFTIAEQNWGKKTVRIVEMDLTKRVSGKVRVYRP